MNSCFLSAFVFCQMQKAIRDSLLTFAPEFNKSMGMDGIKCFLDWAESSVILKEATDEI